MQFFCYNCLLLQELKCPIICEDVLESFKGMFSLRREQHPAKMTVCFYTRLGLHLTRLEHAQRLAILAPSREDTASKLF